MLEKVQTMEDVINLGDEKLKEIWTYYCRMIIDEMIQHDLVEDYFENRGLPPETPLLVENFDFDGTDYSCWAIDTESIKNGENINAEEILQIDGNPWKAYLHVTETYFIKE